MIRDEKEKLASEILSIYLTSGFGSVSKRDIDLLLFHHITQSKEKKGKSNYELAALLKIPESRIKALRLASALKHQVINSKAIIGNVIIRLAKAQQYTAIENGKIEISLEDPIEKREIENFLKSKGYFAEYSFNAEVLRIAPARLFELIVENLEHPKAQFDILVRQCIDDQTISERILESAPTLKQKFTSLRKEALSISTMASLIGSAVSLFSA